MNRTNDRIHGVSYVYISGIRKNISVSCIAKYGLNSETAPHTVAVAR